MSIWSKIAKGAAIAGAIAGVPFTGGMSLATTLPWLTGTLAATAIGAGAIGTKLGNKAGTAEKNAASGMSAIQQEAGAQGREFGGLAEKSLNPATSYWNRILTGDQGTMSEVMAPEVGAINDQYNTTFQTQQELSARGGGRSQLLSSLPYMKARQVGDLYSKIRPQAAKELASIGSTAGGISAGSYGAATGAGRASLDYEAKRRSDATASGVQLGKDLAGILFGSGENKGLLSSVFK